ncbi:MAG: thermonuclease family protein [Nitrospiraceae bacterium]|nr:thermonuclease family protein [Nitrospiraceae bacterium]
MSRRAKILVVSVLTIVSLLYGFGERLLTEGRKRPDNSVRVLKVNDGDTITVVIGRRNERIRLIGMDAPELQQRPWGDRAKDYLNKLVTVSSRHVTLEYDVERRDKYGRLLAYVRLADGRLANEEMLRAGYAVLFTFPPNVRYVDMFTAAQQEARQKEIGIWGKDGIREQPVEFRRKHPRYR